jgi:hypothetical protein
LNQEIVAGDVAMSLKLPEPERLDVLVRFPGMIDELSGWTLDIIDRKTARLLSNRVILSDPQAVEAALEYRARFAYLPVQAGDTPTDTELLRLTPPDTVTAPRVYFERTVLELFQDGVGVIDQLKALPKPVAYTGRVNRRGTPEPAPASLTLVAKEIESTNGGIVTSFSRTVKTNEEGVFEVELLPGDYVVDVQPLDEELAHTTTELTVALGSEVQAGKVLEMAERSSIEGRLRSATGRPVTMVPLEALAPPQAASLDVIESARGQAPSLPVAQGVTTDSAGQFSFLADPGDFYVIARPDASSGFPWGLRLNVSVSEGTSQSLNGFRLSHPYVIEGELTSSDVGSVPSALIRAYAFLRDGSLINQPDLATSVTAVGEARVDTDGRFQLLLPAQLE